MSGFEIVFLAVYFAVLGVLAIYGSHRYRMAVTVAQPNCSYREVPRATCIPRRRGGIYWPMLCFGFFRGRNRSTPSVPTTGLNGGPSLCGRAIAVGGAADFTRAPAGYFFGPQ